MTRLYLPVETAARELDGKLLLALYTANKGITTVVGNRALMNARLHRFEPGIYLSHNFDRGRRRILKLLRQMGHHMVGWDEEGLVWVDEDTYRRRRVHDESIGQLNTVFAWGALHAGALAPVCEKLGVELVEAGNPRADLLGPRYRPLYQDMVSDLNREFGDFILINSNFGWLNYTLAQQQRNEKSDEELAAIAAKSNHPLGYLKHRYQVFHSFLEMLPNLAARFPDRTIVVRPHPSESSAGWELATKHLKNVVVRYDSDLIPWLLAADAIIHNGCTTAIEAALLGQVTIMYRAHDGGKYEIRQPLSVSIEAQTQEDVFQQIANGKHGRMMPESVHQVLDDMVANLDQRPGVEVISDFISNIDKTRFDRAGLRQRLSGKLKLAIRMAEKRYARSSPTSPANLEYISQKFPPTSEDDIRQRLTRLSELSGLSAPLVKMVSDRIFEIAPSK